MRRTDRRGTWLVVAALLVMTGPAGAQLPSNSLPAFIADERLLIGRYHYEERSDDFKIDVVLNADHTASYRITTGKDAAEFAHLTGFWTLDGPYIHIHNRPGPVRLVPAGPPTRDRSVGWSVTATYPDGRPAQGIGVTWAEANGLYMLSDGTHVGEADGPVTLEILRAADRKLLQTVTVTPGGPNRFRFIYHPSDQEPFDIGAIALDPQANVLEVEVGTAQAKLRRVPGPKG